MVVHQCQPSRGAEGIAEVLGRARPGDMVQLAAGRYRLSSTLHLSPGITLTGPPDSRPAKPALASELSEAARGPGAVLVGAVAGAPMIVVDGDGVTLQHLGIELDPDACDGIEPGEHLLRADDVQGLCVDACLFDGGGRAGCAIAVRRSRNAEVRGCTLRGCCDGDLDSRAVLGLWSVQDATIRDNTIIGGSRSISVGRDLASLQVESKVHVIGNRCSVPRLGCVLFLSSDGCIEGNECWDARSGPGIFVHRDSEAADQPSLVEVVGNRCYGNAQTGIVFGSSNGRIEGNECWDARSGDGITVLRDPLAANQPCQVEVVSNWCHSNADSGIVFFSSNGRIEGNECWDARSGQGIVVRRDPLAADQPSQVEVVSNRCHSNADSGIIFFSSNGRIEGNECWDARSGPGIVVQRDPLAADQPSQVEAVGNRCHSNADSGIAFISSNGRIEGNECWDARSGAGIVVQRDPQAADQPSQVEAVGNRCHGNTGSGIAFFSCHGRIEGNECWDARSGPGIMVQRDSQASDQPSQVEVVSNRCHNNDDSGIAFLSCNGRIEGNECWDARSGDGITVLRDPLAADQPSQVEVVGNRCHGNAGCGIVFFSSHGSIEGNECWDSRSGPGIGARRDPKSADQPSQVEAVGNRCHRNADSGIVFFSSNGRIEGNECWDARSGPGIAVQHDAKTADWSSQVEVVGNRCHGNAGGGIGFFSCLGRIEGNKCWDARSGPGIGVRRDEYAADQPSQVEVVGNHCYGNAGSGIAFLSSNGRIEGNECWDARSGDGIVVKRDPLVADQPSQVEVVGNRCHGNAGCGVFFSGSAGTLDDISVVGNGLSAVRIEGHPRPRVGSEPKTEPVLPGYHLALRRASHPLREWLSAVPSAPALAVADAVQAVPCRRLLETLLRSATSLPVQTVTPKGTAAAPAFTVAASWLADKSSVVPAIYRVDNVAALSVPADAATVTDMPGEAPRAEANSASPRQTHRTRIARCGAGDADWLTRLPADGVPALNALWLDVLRRTRTARPMRSAPLPCQSVALISADEPALQVWLNRVQASPRARGRTMQPSPRATVLEGHWLDPEQGTRRAAPSAAAAWTSDGGDAQPEDWLGVSSFVTAAKLHGLGRRQRWGVRLAAVLLAPARHFWPLLLAPIFVAPWLQLRLKGALADRQLLQAALKPMPDMTAMQTDLLAGLALAWRAIAALILEAAAALDSQPLDPVIWSASAWPLSVLLLTWIVLLNRLLPGRTGFTLEGFAEWLDDADIKLPFLRWMLRSPLLAPPLRRLMRSPSAQRAWLRRQLFGPRWHYRLPWRRPAPAVLVLRGVDVVGLAQAAELRALPGLAPRGQVLVIVTQMAGLSMLVGAYLDVWEAAVSAHIERWVIHDPKSTRIAANPGCKPTQGDEADPYGLKTMARILGWKDEDADKFGHDLVAEPPHPNVWPAVLVLGSTPQAPMSLEVLRSSENTSLTAALRPVQRTLGLPFAELPNLFRNTTVDLLRDMVLRADGLLLVRRRPVHPEHWVGRVGWRVGLAAAMRRRFAQGVEQNGPNRGEPLLARWLAAGELHHASQVARLLIGCDNRTSRQRGLLHLEAALHLAEERMALRVDTSLQAELCAHLEPEWQQVAKAFKVEHASLHWAASESARACGALWRMQALLTPHVATLLDLPEPESLLTALSCGDPPLGADMPAPLAVLWDDVAALVSKLATMPAWQAHRLWQARLAQDWHPLPRSLRDALAARGPVAFTQVALRTLVTAEDAATLLARAERLAERPWLVIQALLVLGAADSLRWRGGERAQRLAAERLRLARVSAGIWTLVQALPVPIDLVSPATTTAMADGSYVHDVLPEDWEPGPFAPGTPAAAALLADGEALQRLVAAWCHGATATRQRAPEVGGLGNELEGVALGVHGSLHRLLDEVVDTAEALLQRPIPAAMA